MIIKRQNRTNYTTLSNEVVEDSRLSYEALGLLTYLLSRPEDWEVHIDQLRARTKIGRDKLYRIVGELQDAGYMKHERERSRGVVTGGRWIVREAPKLERDSTRKTESDLLPENTDEAPEPNPEKPNPAEPHPAFQDAYKGLTDTNSGKAQSERDAGAPAREAEDKIPDRDRLDRLKAKSPTAAYDSEAEIDAEWTKLARPKRFEAEATYEEWLAGAKKLGRGKIPGLPAYLREAKWERILTNRGQVAQTVAPRIDAFSRAWSWLWHKAAENGDSQQLRDRVSLAQRHGIGWPIDEQQREQIERSAESLVAVHKASDEAKAWIAYYRDRRMELPLPDGVDWIFVPSQIPAEPEPA